MEYYVTRNDSENELYHYGVKGMKWGVRRKYPTVAQAHRKANKAGNEARKESIAKSRDTDGGIGSLRRANQAANKARKEAYKSSLKEQHREIKENKLNKQAAKTSSKTAKYKQYEQAYKLSDAGAKGTLTPTQYARYATSGARMAQKRRVKELKRASDKSIEKTRKMIKRLSNNYNLTYDVTTGTYTIKNKQ